VLNIIVSLTTVAFISLLCSVFQAANAHALAAEAKAAALLSTSAAGQPALSTDPISEAEPIVSRETTAATPESTPEKAKKGVTDRLRTPIKKDSPASADYIAKVRMLETQVRGSEACFDVFETVCCWLLCIL
jgi:hypothetical protein